MRDTDSKALGVMLKAVMAMHGKELTAPVFDIWWEVLKAYELTDVRRALNVHMQNPDAGQFPPKPADIIRYLQGSTGTQALRAWSKVEKAIRHVGPYQSVVFDDPSIHAVINDMGGWIKVCEGNDDELPFKAREFERRYQGYALNPPREYPKALIGMAEAENRRDGFKLPPPVLIGNEGKALACYRNGNRVAALPIKRPRSLAEVIGHEPQEQEDVRRIPSKLETSPRPPFTPDPERRVQIKAELDRVMAEREGPATTQDQPAEEHETCGPP